ncbi:MAG: serpin family protein [Nanoarchaeota archaeon]|nr:serpin family protein [Nanoarchaeota archaeon]MBU1269403.1 serpin family protein [Nanoarchaeota archaeon]MBU1604320.1 serpin family protein [Nanoarchaeota archaeon]MBU2442932.1 serpin family protein [Nanoarchaeota archaeon]
MNKNFVIIGLIAVLSILLFGCEKQVEMNDVGSTLEGVNSVVNANNQFAFDLYSQYKSGEENIFFSPYSISAAFAMTYEGARDDTADEIQKVFYLQKDDTMRRSSFAKIYNDINKGNKDYKLSTANALWAQKDYAFLDEYFEVIGQHYGGKVTNLDFVGKTEESRQTINRWVEDETNDKIKDLIPVGALDSMTRLVLTNAIYFKGDWTKQFEKKNTRDEDFRVNQGLIVKAPMMSLTGKEAKFNYTETDDVQVLEMAYKGGDLSMIVILPKTDDLEIIEESIDATKVVEWKGLLREQRVDVYFPKFKFETTYSMAETLANMGMPTAFTDSADFSGMTGKKDLMISKVIHKAFVEVDEKGTEAAAATAIIMQVTSIQNPTPIPIFRADHPFIFLIQDKATGEILFLGRVSDPNA